MNKLIANFILVSFLFSHGGNNNRKIEFPDLPGLKTLVCDLHMHTVFSDGSVWPTIRVQESFKDGLDAISLTEHLEYQPYSADIPNPDRNRSYHVAKKYADDEKKNKVGSSIGWVCPSGTECDFKSPVVVLYSS